MSEAETAFLMKVLVGAGILFVIGYIGNMLSFSSRFMNALVTAVVFALIYGALYFVIGGRRTHQPRHVLPTTRSTTTTLAGA